MKQNQRLFSGLRPGNSRFGKMLHLTVITLFLCGQLNASVFQEKGKVKINEKSIDLHELIWKLQEKTDYEFIFNEADLKVYKNLAVNEEGTVNDILDNLLADKNLTYKLSDGVYVIKKKQQKALQKKLYEINIKVVDKDNIAIPGASVVVKGSTKGGATDINGKLNLTVEKQPKFIVVSFIGMKTKEVAYVSNKEFTVKLEGDNKTLTEVIATGYGVVDRRKSSSATTTVEAKDVLEAGVTSIDNMLEGKVAGLAVLGNTGTPGAAPKIRIRGASSISGNREPVWVVDGVILEDPVKLNPQDLNSMDNVNLVGNAISGINPDDIKSITVLKDASATALYGVRAANGVIIVTTKSGVRGAPSFSFSTSNSLKLRPDYDNLNLMNSSERIDLSEEIFKRGLHFSFDPGRVGYEGALMDLFDGNINQEEFTDRVERMKSVNTDWYDLMFETAVSTKNSFSVSGGDDKVRYYMSLGYAKDNSNEKGKGLKEYTMRSNLSFKFSNKFDIALRMNTARTEKEYSHSSIKPYKYAYNTSRALPAFNEDGTRYRYLKKRVKKHPIYYNVLDELDHTGREVDLNRTDINASFNYRPFSNFKLNALIGMSSQTTKDCSWADEKSYYAAILRGLNYDDPFPVGEDLEDFKKTTGSKLPYGGIINTGTYDTKTYSGRLMGDYLKTFKDIHELSLKFGTEIRSTEYTGFNDKRAGYFREKGRIIMDIDPTIWLAYGKQVGEGVYSSSETNSINNTIGFFGAFTYTFNQKLTANFNIRADGSNKFGQDERNKFLPVWSASARYNLSEESIFDNIKWLNLFALKASYGVQGNVHPDQTPNLNVRIHKLDSKSGENQSKLSKWPNPNLRWEKTISTNYGFEFSIFDGRIDGDFDYYYKKGEDQIVSMMVPVSNGARSVSMNQGDVENKGWELTINSKIIDSKDFGLRLGFNAYYNENKVTAFNPDFGEGGHSSIYSNYYTGDIISKGKALNSFYSYKFDKLDSQGYPVFKGTDLSGVKNMEDVYNQVFTYSGKLVPDFNGGINLGVRYKAFNLRTSWSYSLGSNIRLNELYDNETQRLPRPEQNLSDEFVKRWRKPGDEAHTVIPTLSDDNLDLNLQQFIYADNRWEMYNNSDLRVVSGDFLRLRSLSLKYTLPQNICDKIKMKHVDVAFQASNLLLFADKDLNGRDPEQISLSSGTAPITKSYTLGINFKF
ncbi:MAG: SusC/RagA family TonB-linked outer membrane protein [Marinifilaceae bacterium]|jgi:TonB-linked SusC/RagA family outer membrane protein|nr:SusC/RagA family TonB-linked outer membrane protein [Marinifilaceae bacterium]